MNDINDPLAQKMSYEPGLSKRPPPPWDHECGLPPVVNAPDTGKYSSKDTPSPVPEGSDGIHGQAKDTH